ncbi:MAG: hypothetical protein JWM52_543 [Candidatus Saccharibacteria bacterium]|nr:hypothetical protein [Candidatus Saccharibacteria bacterium]
MTHTIKRDYFWNTLGVLAQNAISPLLLIAVTRLNGVTDSGLFSFAFSLAIIFWALGIWGGRTYQVSDVKHEFTPRSYVILRVVLSLVMIVGSIIFCMLNDYEPVKTAVILALVLFKAIESIADAVYGILQVHGHLFITGKSLLLKAVFGFAVFIAIDIYTKDILLGSLGIVGANLLVLFAYDLPNARKFDKVWVGFSQLTVFVNEAVIIIKRTWPIAIVILLSMFSLLIPRYFVDSYHDEQIGYFGILAMPITALGLIITFILQPNVVRLSQQFSKKYYEKFHAIVKNLLIWAGIIGALILIATYFIGTQALELVFGIDFSIYKSALIIMVFGAAVNAYVSIYINILTIMRHFKGQFYVLLFTNIGLVIVSMVFVNTFGLIGAVVLYTLTNLIQAIILSAVYKRLMRRMIHQRV